MQHSSARTSATSFSKDGKRPDDHHRLPVRANTGGFLRSPLEVSSAFAAAAEKHVGGATGRGGSSSAIVRAWQSRSDETEDDDSWMEGRRWTRAGVGAASLTVTQKTSQQAAAERVYGGGDFASGGGRGVDGEEDGDVVQRETLQVAQSHQFGVDRREKETLKTLMPRALRQEQRRRLRQGGSVSGKADRNEEAEAEEEELAFDPKHGEAADHPLKRPREDLSSARISGHSNTTPGSRMDGGSATKSARTENHSGKVSSAVASNIPPQNNDYQQGNKRGGSGAGTTLIVGKPMNRMQQIQRMREEALFGKKGKKR